MFTREEMGEVIDGHTLRFVRTVKHRPERVWRAITDAQELAAWMRYAVPLFEAREGGRVHFFGEDERTAPGIDGKIFIFDPPRTLAYSFYDPRNAEHAETGERTWSVRWDLEPCEGGCRITFLHCYLPAAALWGLGEGWHGFLDQLVAYFEGSLDELWAEFKRLEAADDLSGLSVYRRHVGDELLAWAEHAAEDARSAATTGRADEAVSALGRVSLGVRQLHRIARQEGARPDYALPDAMPSRL
jgi:uncharacterized protein YndB with AHSA1/START domain